MCAQRLWSDWVDVVCFMGSLGSSDSSGEHWRLIRQCEWLSLSESFIEFQEIAEGGAGEGRRGYSAKRSSDSRVAYAEVKLQVRDLVRVVGIIAFFAPRGVNIWGKNGFI